MNPSPRDAVITFQTSFCPLFIFSSWKLFESSFLLCLTIVLKSYSGRGYHSVPLRKIQQLEERANAEENNPRAQAEYLKVRLQTPWCFFLTARYSTYYSSNEGRTFLGLLQYIIWNVKLELCDSLSFFFPLYPFPCCCARIIYYYCLLKYYHTILDCRCKN